MARKVLGMFQYLSMFVATVFVLYLFLLIHYYHLL